MAVDTNLLILLAVGLTSPAYIEAHKRLRVFSAADFGTLIGLIGSDRLVLTPNTLTETSNLLDGIRNQEVQQQVDTKFKHLIETQIEDYVLSTHATRRAEFARLGLADCVLLSLAADGARLLTMDLQLYLAARRAGYSAENFNYYIEA